MGEIKSIIDISIEDILMIILSIYIPFIITKYSEKNKNNREILNKTSIILKLILSDLVFNSKRIICACDTIDKIMNNPIKYSGRNVKWSNRKNYYLTEAVFDELKRTKQIDTSSLDYLMRFKMKDNLIFDIKDYNHLIESLNQEVEKIYKSQTVLNKSQLYKLFDIFNNITKEQRVIDDKVKQLDKIIDKSCEDLIKVSEIPSKLLKPIPIMTILILIMNIIMQISLKINIFDFSIIKFLYYGLPIISLITVVTIEKIIMGEN